MIDNSRILVTGGAGFIGSSLVENLLSRNNEVVVLDNFSTGRIDNLKSALENPRFKLMEGDICDSAVCLEAVDGVEYVLHEAAIGSVPRSIDDPVLTARVNISGFVNILHASVKAGVKRFVYAASSSVYGDAEYSPKIEDRIGRQLSPYAISKRVDEMFAANFHDIYGIDTIGLRYFNVFGCRQDPSGDYAAVIPLFAKRLLEHKSPVINGDGSFSRDFTHVSNVVLANNLAMSVQDNAALNQVYNVACGRGTSLNRLFDVLKDALAGLDAEISGINPVYGPERAGDIPHSLASIEKISRLLKYSPVTYFEDGILETADWYAKNL